MESESPLGLSFDKARFKESSSPDATVTCAFCQRDLAGSYFEINGSTACESCRGQAEEVRSRGFSIGRGFRALMAGGAGGVAGALLYYAVAALTGYEVGLVAIAVGLLVGFGVRWGSGGVGGRGYQVLAVAITYVAIVSTYVPFIFEEIRKQAEAENVEGAEGEPASGAAGSDVEAAAVAADPSESPEEEVTGLQVALALGAFVLFILATPFLAGVQNAIGILIIGFALFEAWKVNRAAPIVIEGPFQVGQAGRMGTDAV
jgi:hypothetical protein